MAKKTTKRKAVVVDENVDITDRRELLKSIANDVNSTLKSDRILIGEEVSADAATVPFWVRSGLPQLDFAVGGYAHPGFPVGRIIEIYGAEASGKSTLAVWLTKQAMDTIDAISYYQDAERVLTQEIINGTGIDMDMVMLDQPDTLEEVFEGQRAVLEDIQAKGVTVPVVTTTDSIASCSTESELDGDVGDAQMAPHARLMSKGLRMVKKLIKDTNVLSIWVNQTREDIGKAWGDKDTTFGGNALKFYASVRIKVTKIAQLKKGDDVYGVTVQAYLIKNKVAPPLRKAQYDILFVEDDDGKSYPMLDTAGAILDWCRDNGLIGGTKSSGRYEVEGKKLYKEQARELLLSDYDLYQKYYDMAYSVQEAAGSSEDSEDE